MARTHRRQKGRGTRSNRRRQRGRGLTTQTRHRRRAIRRQRGRGKVTDFLKKVKTKLVNGLKRVVRSKQGKKIAKKASKSLLKAGTAIVLDGANPRTTLRRSLKKTGKEIGGKILAHYMKNSV